MLSKVSVLLGGVSCASQQKYKTTHNSSSVHSRGLLSFPLLGPTIVVVVVALGPDRRGCLWWVQLSSLLSLLLLGPTLVVVVVGPR